MTDRITYCTAVRKGEQVHEAIFRAQVAANIGGYSAYCIVCEKCGQPINDHEVPQDCEIWLKAIGKKEFDP